MGGQASELRPVEREKRYANKPFSAGCGWGRNEQRQENQAGGIRVDQDMISA